MIPNYIQIQIPENNWVGDINSKVKVVKAIRALTGMGLKEAIAAAGAGVQQLKIDISTYYAGTLGFTEEKIFENGIAELRNNGVAVTVPASVSSYDTLLQGLRKSAADAVLLRNYNLANALVGLLQVYDYEE